MISKGRLCHENNIKDDTYCCRKDLIVAICVALNKLSCLPSWNRHTEIMKSSAVKQCQPSDNASYKLSTSLEFITSCWQLWQLLQVVASFDSCYKLLPVLTAVASFDSCYKLLTALTAVTSCCQPWQAANSIGSCYKLLPALTGLTSCRQHWQLLQAVAGFDSCYNMLPVLTAVTSCCQLL